MCVCGGGGGGGGRNQKKKKKIRGGEEGMTKEKIESEGVVS